MIALQIDAGWNNRAKNLQLAKSEINNCPPNFLIFFLLLFRLVDKHLAYFLIVKIPRGSLVAKRTAASFRPNI